MLLGVAFQIALTPQCTLDHDRSPMGGGGGWVDVQTSLVIWHRYAGVLILFQATKSVSSCRQRDLKLTGITLQFAHG